MLRSGKRLIPNVKETVILDGSSEIEEIMKSKSQPILLDDLKPGSKPSPERGRSNQTRGFEEPRPDLDDQEG